MGRATGGELTKEKVAKIFQSTPSVGRATRMQTTKPQEWAFQSTPSVGRATIFEDGKEIANFISIHALRGEGDTVWVTFADEGDIISIHALRGEGDTI